MTGKRTRGPGRKEDLIKAIALRRFDRGMSMAEVQASTRGYRRKSLEKLRGILKAEGRLKAALGTLTISRPAGGAEEG